MVQAHPDYRRPRIAAFILAVGLPAQALSEACLATSTAFLGVDPRAFNEAQFEPTTLPDILYALAALAVLSLLCLNFVALMFWVWRTNKNTHLLVEDLNYEPGWAVGWWFVPVMNLFKPFDMMSELYGANKDPKGWSRDKGAALIIGWWVVTIAAGIAGIVTRMAEQTSANLSNLESVLYGLGSLRLVLLFVVVSRIGNFQKRATQTISGVERVF